MQPLVTVIIPCFNHAKWVADAILSIANQDYPNKRIVMTDDGSTDGSHAVAVNLLYKPMVPNEQAEVWACHGKVRHTDCEMTIQRLPKSHGCPFARNWGLHVSWKTAGELFMFLDSDDYFLPGKITKSVNAWLEAPANIGMVYTDYDIERPDGSLIRNWSEPYSRERLCVDNIINPNSLVSKVALEQCGFFEESYRVCEDYDMWLRISEKFMIVHIPESLAVKRVGPHDSTSTVPSEKWQSDYAKVKQRMYDRAKRETE